MPAAPSTDALTATAWALAEDRHDAQDSVGPPAPYTPGSERIARPDRAAPVPAPVQAAAPTVDLARLRSGLAELDLHDAVDNDHDNGYRQALTDVRDLIAELVGQTR